MCPLLDLLSSCKRRVYASVVGGGLVRLYLIFDLLYSCARREYASVVGEGLVRLDLLVSCEAQAHGVCPQALLVRVRYGSVRFSICYTRAHVVCR